MVCMSIMSLRIKKFYSKHVFFRMRDSVSHWKYSKYDGLSTANYRIGSVDLFPLFTRITVRIRLSA